MKSKSQKTGRVAQRFSSFIALASFFWRQQPSAGFSAVTTTGVRFTGYLYDRFVCVAPRSRIARYATNGDSQQSASVDALKAPNGTPNLSGALANAEWIEFELAHHKPLGCSVEESLANEPDGAKYVFIAQVNEGGNADNAGLQVGDVIVQLSGTFDEVVDVAGLGIDKIRSLVAGRLKENPLSIRVARGSDVMERHELALVELCIVGDDAAASECIASIYQYNDDDVYVVGDSDIATCEDDEIDCVLDSIWDTWSEDLPAPMKEEKKEETTQKKKKVAPWSSRSSPSGTYVRDPRTGIMRNIDE